MIQATAGAIENGAVMAQQVPKDASGNSETWVYTARRYAATFHDRRKEEVPLHEVRIEERALQRLRCLLWPGMGQRKERKE